MKMLLVLKECRLTKGKDCNLTGVFFFCTIQYGICTVHNLLVNCSNIYTDYLGFLSLTTDSMSVLIVG